MDWEKEYAKLDVLFDLIEQENERVREENEELKKKNKELAKQVANMQKWISQYGTGVPL